MTPCEIEFRTLLGTNQIQKDEQNLPWGLLELWRVVLLQETEIPPACPASKLIILAELTSLKYFECTGTFLFKSLG